LVDSFINTFEEDGVTKAEAAVTIRKALKLRLMVIMV